MKKKPKGKTADKWLNLRCTEADRKLFREAAEREGFRTVSAWVFYHLKKIARETTPQ